MLKRWRLISLYTVFWNSITLVILVAKLHRAIERCKCFISYDMGHVVIIASALRCEIQWACIDIGRYWLILDKKG